MPFMVGREASSALGGGVYAGGQRMLLSAENRLVSLHGSPCWPLQNRPNMPFYFVFIHIHVSVHRHRPDL